jgi:hypothetical protein
MGLKDLKAVSLRGSKSGAYPGESMAKISSALLAVILGCFQVQRDHTIALPGVFHCAFVGGFDPEVMAAAIQARRSFDGLSSNIDTLVPINAFDFKARKP